MKRTVLSCLLILTLCVSGCGSSSSDSYAQNSAQGYSLDSASSSAGYGVADYDYSYESDSYEDTESVQETSQKEVSTDGSSDTGVIDRDKLVYRGSISISTIDFDEAVSAFKSLVNEYDGFLENERMTDNSYVTYDYDEFRNRDRRYSYTATIRVPSKSYEEFFTKSKDIGSVTESSSNVENITQQYNTTKTTLEIYQTKYDRYLELLEQAIDVSDMREIENELTNIEIQLAQYQTALSVMDTDVAYSYLDISINQVTKRSEMETEDTFFTRLTETFEDSWKTVLNFLEGVLFWIIMYWWYIAILIGVVFLIRKWNRWWRSKHPKKEAPPSKRRTYISKDDMALKESEDKDKTEE